MKRTNGRRGVPRQGRKKKCRAGKLEVRGKKAKIMKKGLHSLVYTRLCAKRCDPVWPFFLFLGARVSFYLVWVVGSPALQEQ